jgi:hypothetical protein
MSEALSEQDAGAQKQKDVEAAGAAPSQWRYAGRFADGAAAAAYINLEPAQHAGEVSATVLSDGAVELFVYF